MENIMEQLLKLIETNPTLSPKQLAVMLNRDEQQVKDMIDDCTAKGIIKGYRAIIDWEKTERAMVKALIELKVTPKKGRGFDEIAMAIASMDEVEGVTLMSGGYDLLVEIKAKSFQEIAMFVFKRLSPMDDVNETATHFVLRPYKQAGIIYHDDEEDGRSFVSL
jgi:DNA-binding Lrp family transcriptional regulator